MDMTPTINDYSREELIDILSYLFMVDNYYQETIKDIRELEYRIPKERWKAVEKASSKKRWKLSFILSLIWVVWAQFENGEIDLFLLLLGPVVGAPFAYFFLLLFRFAEPKKKEKEAITADIQKAVAEDEQLNQLREFKHFLETDEFGQFYRQLVPQNFANTQDYSGMIALLKDFRASNFQEVANLWRAEQHRQQVANQQKQIAHELRQSQINLSEMRQSMSRLQTSSATTAAQLASANDKLRQIERYGVHAHIRK